MSASVYSSYGSRRSASAGSGAAIIFPAGRRPIVRVGRNNLFVFDLALDQSVVVDEPGNVVTFTPVWTVEIDPASPKRLIPRLRRLLSRAGPEREEINILRGLFAALEEPLHGATPEFLKRRFRSGK